jgi:hypothetical protein
MSIPKEYLNYLFFLIAVFGASIILALIYRTMNEQSIFAFTPLQQEPELIDDPESNKDKQQ